MAKFKKGDKVTDGNAVYEITDVDDGVYSVDQAMAALRETKGGGDHA